ncbi:Putative inhibitor of apoptosis 2 [Halyomorpha halys]|nr:Putative inhibitor of apoptosis 2 [Halyomorpha halys]
MNSEESRLRTYAHWPENAPVDARRIAAAGFYYMGQGLEVQCFSCGGRISEWNIGDSVMSKHRVLDPFCPFVQNPILSGNIPLISDRRNSPNTSQENQSVYQNEKSRLDTFTAWPIRSIVSPELLVKSGFYYTQLKDKVRCAYCQGVVEKWEVGDDPDIEHRRLFPNCSFIRNKMLSDMNIAHQSGISIRNSDVDSIEGNLKELGVQDHRIPRHGKFSTYDSRLNTFSQWPPSLTQKPHDLAEAGFYFTGRGDQVRCFHCDGGLRLWEREDDPWLEHARWFPHCGFLLLIKGQEFVDEARAAGVQNSVGPNYNDVKTREESPLRRIHSVTEQQLQDLMNTPFVIQALRQRMESVGVPFSTPEALVVAALEIQTEQLASAEGEHWCSQVQPKEAETPPSVEPTPPHEDCISNTPQVNSPVSLEEENRRLREARLCKICMDYEVGVVFLPCRHLITCVNCAHSLADCPLCRQAIKATVRTFLS